MAALTVSYDAQQKEGKLIAYPVAAATTVFKGGLLTISGATGYVHPGADAAGAVFVGVAYEDALNVSDSDIDEDDQTGVYLGPAGALNVRVIKTGTFVYKRVAAVLSDIGKVAFLVDDNTVSTAATTNSIACGVVVAVPDTAHVTVRIDTKVN